LATREMSEVASIAPSKAEPFLTEVICFRAS